MLDHYTASTHNIQHHIDRQCPPQLQLLLAHQAPSPQLRIQAVHACHQFLPLLSVHVEALGARLQLTTLFVYVCVGRGGQDRQQAAESAHKYQQCTGHNATGLVVHWASLLPLN